MAVQFLDQGNQVDGPRGFGQVHHPRINTAMGVERKIVRLQTLRGLVVGEIVEQNRAQDGALGFYVGRQTMRETVVGSRQNFLSPVRNHSYCAGPVHKALLSDATDETKPVHPHARARHSPDIQAPISMPRCPRPDIHPPSRPEYRRINSEYQEPAPGILDIGLPGVGIDSGRGREIRASSGRKINAAQASHPSRIARERRANSPGQSSAGP